MWLSQNALLLTINLLVSFYFINSPYFVWTATPFCLFFLMELSHFCLCECHTNIMCASIISVWMSHMRVSIFFVWVSHRYPCIFITSKWTLHFASFWIITDPFSLLSCVDYHTSFFKWNSTCPTSFLSFGITDLFMTAFRISNGIIHLQLIFAKHHYVNTRSFVLCTLLLTHVSYFVT